jgi:hypothetical protein
MAYEFRVLEINLSQEELVMLSQVSSFSGLNVDAIVRKALPLYYRWLLEYDADFRAKVDASIKRLSETLYHTEVSDEPTTKS